MLLRNGKTLTTVASRELEKAERAYYEAVDKVAAVARAKYVVPLCRRKGWTFIAGMGGWAFYDKHNEPVDGDLIPKRVLEALQQEIINRANDLGSLMQDYPSNS